MDSLTFKDLYKVEVKVYIIWKITCTLSYHYLNHPKTNCTMTATKGIGFGLVFKGTRGEGREEGTTDKLTKVRPTW